MKLATIAAFSGLFAVACLVACGDDDDDGDNGNDAGTGGARASGGASNGGTATSGGAPTGGNQSSGGSSNPLPDGGDHAPDASSGGAPPDGSVPQPDAARTVEAGAPDGAADGGTKDVFTSCGTASVVNGVLTNLQGGTIRGSQHGLTLVNLCVRRLKGMPGSTNGWFTGEIENRSGTLQCEPQLSISLDGRAGNGFLTSTPSYTHPSSPRNVSKCLAPGGKAFFGALVYVPEGLDATAPVEYSVEATPGTTQVVHPATPTVDFKAELVSVEYVMTATVHAGPTGISSGLAVVVATRDPSGLVRSFHALPVWNGLEANAIGLFSAATFEPNPPAEWLVAVIFSGVSSS